jgi:hypothetical protein
MSPTPTLPRADRRRAFAVAAIAVAATLLFSWATWALFLAPRDGHGTVEGFVEEMARLLREGDFDAVRERLDPSFSLEPGGLDRDAALAVARRGRFFPYVALTHPIAGGGVEDETRWAALGIVAEGNPERKRDVSLRAVRLELRIREDGDGFRVLSAVARQGR